MPILRRITGNPRTRIRNELLGNDSDEHVGETSVSVQTDMVHRYVQFGQTVVHRTTRVFQTVGGWFQEKFTGRNTIDPKHGQDDDNDEQEPSADPYSRPVQPQ